jgi:CDP-glucose 4,6-dehydratase
MLKKFYKNRKILVTGASGFKGSWLSYSLCLMHAKVYGLGIKKNNNEKLFNQLKLKSKIDFRYIDIRNYEKLKKFINLSKPSIIFHLAAQPIVSESYKRPSETINTNAIGTLNLIDICKEFNFIKAIICITSDKCYKSNHSTTGFKEGDHLGGDDPYSASKACAEIIANSYYKSFYKKKNKGLATTRAGNVIGGGDWSPNRLFPDCIKSLINNEPIKIRSPNFNRPWQHVLDPIFGYLLLAVRLNSNAEKYSGPWNFGPKTKKVISVQEVVKEIIKYWGSGNYKRLNNNKFYEQKNLQLNILKSKKILKWSPKYSIKTSVKKTVEWYKSVYFSKDIDVEKVTKKQINSYMNQK